MPATDPLTIWAQALAAQGYQLTPRVLIATQGDSAAPILAIDPTLDDQQAEAILARAIATLRRNSRRDLATLNLHEPVP